METQIRCRATAIGLPDFFHNVRLNNFEGVCHVERGKVCLFQFRIYGGLQRV